MTRDNGSDGVVAKTCNCLAMHIIPLKTAIENRDAEISTLKSKLLLADSHLEASRNAWSDRYRAEDAAVERLENRITELELRLLDEKA